MKISIIIPYYNAKLYIKQCLLSVYNQTVNEKEIIVINDGSDKENTDYLVELMSKFKDTIYISQPNMNASVARNRGIDIAKGDYILFLDSDDYLYENNVLDRMLKDIEGYDLLIGNYIEFNESGKEIEYNVNNDFKYDCKETYRYAHLSPPPTNKLYKMSIIKQFGVYFSNVRIGQDLNFFLKYLAIIKNVKLVDYNIYMYRQINSGMTRSMNMNFLEIVSSINQVKKFYYNYSLEKEYNNYISSVAIKHYCQQLTRIPWICNKDHRKAAFFYLRAAYKEAMKDNKNCEFSLKSYNKKFKLFSTLFPLFNTNIFCKYYRKHH